jgi:hypothetical protein
VPHEINVVRAQATPDGDGYTLDFPILVGGSNLQRRPQPGTWTVAVGLDDQPETAARATVILEMP